MKYVSPSIVGPIEVSLSSVSGFSFLLFLISVN